MSLDKRVTYWMDSAEHDLISAEVLFKNSHYDWCLFIGCLVIEKALKALFVLNKNDYPPKTHDLLYFQKVLNLDLTQTQIETLYRINSFNMEARYPDEKFEFYKLCTEDFSSKYFNEIKELFQWLKSQLN